MPAVAGLGHVGIYTHDLFKMRDFYSRVMGLEITDEVLLTVLKTQALVKEITTDGHND